MEIPMEFKVPMAAMDLADLNRKGQCAQSWSAGSNEVNVWAGGGRVILGTDF